MQKPFTSSTLALATSLGLTALSNAAVYTYNMSADNDMTFYTGNSTGTVLTEHFNQTARWATPITGTLTSFDDYIYVVGMNFGGPGSFAGYINGIDVSTLPWETTINVAGALTGYTGSSTLYNPPIPDVAGQILIQPFSPAVLTGSLAGVGIPGVANSIDIAGAGTAQIFRLDVNSIPEPSTTLLGAAAGMLCLFRRRRQVA